MFKKIKSHDLEIAHTIYSNLLEQKNLSAEDLEFLSHYHFNPKTPIAELVDNLAFAIQPYYYLGANPTADCVIIYKGQVLLIQRADNAVEGGKWAIPGGFVDTTAGYGEKWAPGFETPAMAALREFLEEAGIDMNSIIAQQQGRSIEPIEIGIFEGNQRDPRDNALSWSKSHAYLFIVPDDIELPSALAGSDASDTKWCSIDQLPENLAFDHAKILNLAIEAYRNSVSPAPNTIEPELKTTKLKF